MKNKNLKIQSGVVATMVLANLLIPSLAFAIDPGFDTSSVSGSVAANNVFQADFGRPGGSTPDGKNDVISINWGGNTVSLFLGNGNGTFQNGNTYSLKDSSDYSFYPLSAGVTDINGDNKPDLVVGGEYGGASGLEAVLEYFLGNGDGTIQSTTPAWITLPAGASRARAISTGDFDQDGKGDVAFAFSNTNDWSSHLYIYYGKADGTLEAGQDITLADYNPVSTVVADFDGDTYSDIAVSVSPGGYNKVQIFPGGGGLAHRSWSTSLDGFSFTGAAKLVAADFNNDLKPDLAALMNDDTRLGVRINTSTGSGNFNFENRVQYSVSVVSTSMGSGDFNGDGNVDLVVTGRWAQQGFSILTGNGDGTFSGTSLNYIDGASFYGVAVADFNGDLKPDIVAADNSTVPLFLNNTVGGNWGGGGGGGQNVPEFSTYMMLLTVIAAGWMVKNKLQTQEQEA